MEFRYAFVLFAILAKTSNGFVVEMNPGNPDVIAKPFYSVEVEKKPAQYAIQGTQGHAHQQTIEIVKEPTHVHTPKESHHTIEIEKKPTQYVVHENNAPSAQPAIEIYKEPAHFVVEEKEQKPELILMRPQHTIEIEKQPTKYVVQENNVNAAQPVIEISKEPAHFVVHDTKEPVHKDKKRPPQSVGTIHKPELARPNYPENYVFSH